MASFASESKLDVSQLPPTRLIVRAKTSILAFSGPIMSNGSTGPEYALQPMEFPQATARLRLSPIYNNQGTVFALIHERKSLALHDAASGELLKELAVTDATHADFSPLGTYLITWSLPTKQGDAFIPNMKVWCVADGQLLSQYVSKAYSSQTMQWTTDERYAVRSGGNELYIYTENKYQPEDTIQKLAHRGFVQFKIAGLPDGCMHLALFNPEASGKPGVASVFKMSADLSIELVASRTIFAASDASLLWNAQGTACLVQSSADVDHSNTSYYGASGCYLIVPAKSISIKVEQVKDGPVQDVAWSPAGKLPFLPSPLSLCACVGVYGCELSCFMCEWVGSGDVQHTLA